ncbi:cenp-a multicopy suppressor 2 [Fusarium sporotrichioides]|uniref:Cenp-a multicopy suppressor 2 n=1 Tax=Fusarium sporotrichioides TaxID=5514 RepID=A0A395RV47_FUSSP|nr:cenp-a multicopy suppressor 2 [Fusarium sporotrichioides]
MASQTPNASQGGCYQTSQTTQQNNELNESGVQVRPMGLKVHYTFDKEAKVNCLARSAQTLYVQTVPLDERNSIGIVDLRACLQAVTECSPELSSQDSEGDFTIYAYDYSEPDTPLVGQGMLSWALDSMRCDWMTQLPKMITGRVTKNVLAVFGGGNRETLEVKLKFSAAGRVLRPEPTVDMQPMDMQQIPLQPTSLQSAKPAETAMTPGAEWNSFIQSNPNFGHTGHVSRVASPALSQAGPMSSTKERRSSFVGQTMEQANSGPDIQRIAPMPVTGATTANPKSRPSSRNSRKKPPTGRPRGRPRKKPTEGNTSGYEDGTEGEDGGSGPATKRAKPTRVEKAAPNPFTSGPESLRVTASTAGSLRNFRPVASNEVVAGNHLQEVPRAPTPVPDRGPLGGPAQAGPKGPKPRRESSMKKELGAAMSNQIPPRPLRALSPSQEDGRSPESPVETPAFSEDSPQDMRSSPPLPPTASFMRSSPPPSSPVLPPMPSLQRQASSFMDNETDDLFDEPILQPAKESQFRQHQPQKVMEDIDSTGIPTQVFRIQDGPDGQGLVHIQNFNTPQPTSTPAGPPPSEPITAKKIPKPRPTRNPPQKRPTNPHQPPTLAPTPPPTTDAPEKNSPVPVSASSPATATQPQTEQSAQPVEEDALFELVRAVSSSSEPTTSTDTNQSIQGSLPTSKSSAGNVRPKPRAPRQLGRSQSAGVLALPSVPASEPLEPSSLSQSMSVEPRASTEIPDCLRRSKAVNIHGMVAASDPVGPSETSLVANLLPTLPEVTFPQSDFPPMPSSPPYKSNKNQVKKDSIKQRLESAIAAGEMPPFCTNCGAIETPTWRKIWVQEHEGIPEYVEYSEKPGRVTAIEILKRGEDKKPLSHRLIKKTLGFDDDRSKWSEKLLCNPCGIWITKYHDHRPQDKWDNAFGHLGQSRKKRSSAGPDSQAKRSRTKSTSVPAPALTSQVYPATDPLGPIQQSSPKQFDARSMDTAANEDVAMGNMLNLMADDGRHIKDMSQSVPGSTHSRVSRGTGTAESPIEMDLDEELGSTRRLLFPSPCKEGAQKTLGELNVNVAKTNDSRHNKEATGKENMAFETYHGGHVDDDIEALFNSPARPSTPPPKSKIDTDSALFKTPTRPTPSHRPITRSVSRSVSRSLRSVRDMLSPNQQALLQRTPTKSPASVRRSPRLNLESKLDNVLDTPLSRTITQLLSEPNFDLNSTNFDFSSLPLLDADPSHLVEFGNFLSTDGILQSSPTKDSSLSFSYGGSDNIWAEWGGTEKDKTTAEKEK